MGLPAAKLSPDAADRIESAVTRAGLSIARLENDPGLMRDQVASYRCQSERGACLRIQVLQPRQLNGRILAVLIPDPEHKSRGFFIESKLTLQLQAILRELEKEQNPDYGVLDRP